MSQRQCDGRGKLPCTCPASVVGQHAYGCTCNLTCGGCDACEGLRERLAAEQAAKDREAADWYYTRVGARPVEAKARKGDAAAKGSDQGRLF
jgi:hypothetical protein